MKKLAIIFASVLILSSCASDTDVSDAMEGVKNTYKEYFELLKTKKEDPAKAVEAGADFIKQNREKLKAIGTKLSGIASEEAIGMVEKGMQEVTEMSTKAGEELALTFAENPQALEQIKSQIEEIASIITGEQIPAAAAEIADEARNLQKKAILDGLDPEALKDIPSEQREEMLSQYLNALQGAGEEEKAAFKEEIRKKLGW